MVHSVLFPIAVTLFLIVSVTATAISVRRSRRVAAGGFEQILERLVTLDRHKLAQVAHDVRAEPAEPACDSWQVWELVGGMAGVEAMATNCEVLIDLVCYVQQWYPEALPLAEQLRLNARQIHWHLDRLRGAEQRGHLQAAFPDYAQRAVATYYAMTKHVLELYEQTQTPGLSQVRAAL